MDWNYFYRLAKKVANQINSSGYKPDIIVGLARGGWVLARVLCDFVGVKDLVSLKVEHWGVTATPDGKAKLKHLLNVDLAAKKVLVVDDITDTGESMRVTVEYLKTLNPSEIRTASLQHLTCAKFKADYVGEVLPWRWVIFPWNFTEDMCTLIPKACRRLKVEIGDDVDVAVIKNEMKEMYTINVTEETVADILNEIRRRNLIQDTKKQS
ncbi:MAG: phosphoribosyltransferase [Candidatus Bathyarchaeum sp.]|nr:MAG: phosphoribosyltransferase [Candidatus Bathyarchaeum sp.]